MSKNPTTSIAVSTAFLFGVLLLSKHSEIQKYLFVRRKWLQASISYKLNCLFRNYCPHSNVEKYSRAPIPGDTQLSNQWLTFILRKNKLIDEQTVVTESKITELSENRGMSQTIKRVVITYNQKNSTFQNPESLILKLSRNETSHRYHCIILNSYREALFYKQFSSEVNVCPKIVYAEGFPQNGSFVILMEDLKNATGLNFYFGNQTWGMKPLENPIPPEVMLENMYLKAAEIHAKYWNNKILFQTKWLKHVDWYLGRNRHTYELTIENLAKSWKKILIKIDKNEIKMKFSEKLKKIVTKSLQESTWEHLQSYLKRTDVPFTLVHGDFHASNMLWKSSSNDEKENRLIMHDWSEAGVWEPMTDLGQTLVSDVKREIWQKYDRILITKYWKRLIELGVPEASFPFSLCWSLFLRGTVTRWIFFILLLTPIVPPEAAQYFHDQLLWFIEDHGDYESYPILSLACITSPPDEFFGGK